MLGFRRGEQGPMVAEKLCRGCQGTSIAFSSDLVNSCQMSGKATTVITRFATAVGMDLEEKTTADLGAIPQYIICLSCSAPIVMGFDAMASPMIVYEETG